MTASLADIFPGGVHLTAPVPHGSHSIWLASVLMMPISTRYAVFPVLRIVANAAHVNEGERKHVDKNPASPGFFMRQSTIQHTYPKNQLFMKMHTLENGVFFC